MNVLLKGNIKRFSGKKKHFLFELELIFSNEVNYTPNEDEILLTAIDPREETEIVIPIEGFPIYFCKIREDYIFPCDGFDYEDGKFTYREELSISPGDSPLRFIAEIETENEFVIPEVQFGSGNRTFRYRANPDPVYYVVDGEMERHKEQRDYIRKVYHTSDIDFIRLLIEVIKAGKSLSLYCKNCNRAQNIHSPTNLYCSSCGRLLITREGTGGPLPRLAMIRINLKDGNMHNAYMYEFKGCSGKIDDLIFIKVRKQWRLYRKKWRLHARAPRIYLNSRENIENTPLKPFDILSCPEVGYNLVVLPLEED